jgi:hypothetical protein
MRRRLFTLLFVVALALFLVSLALAAPQFTLLSWTIDSGGGRTLATPYILTGSIGQPDAGVLTGGGYNLTGGFLGIGDPTPTPIP